MQSMSHWDAWYRNSLVLEETIPLGISRVKYTLLSDSPSIYTNRVILFCWVFPYLMQLMKYSTSLDQWQEKLNSFDVYYLKGDSTF